MSKKHPLFYEKKLQKKLVESKIIRTFAPVKRKDMAP